MKVIEITIDLTNPNQKPDIRYWEVTKETENYLHSKAKYDWEHGRRFYKKSLDQIHYPKKLVYTYQFLIKLEDYREIDKSEKMEKAMYELKKKIDEDLNYYQAHTKGIFDYYLKNYK